MRSSRFSRGIGEIKDGALSRVSRTVSILLYAWISRELRLWRRAGHAPCLWWRDDDARQPSESLDRLLGLSTFHRVPLALAVIPDGDLGELAAVIARHPMVSVIQHGCDHVDRNIGGGFSAEFNPAAPIEEIAKAIVQSWGNLASAVRATPIYAPPWNVLTPNARSALLETHFRTVSLYGKRTSRPGGLSEVNTHIDIMRWRPARFRGGAAVLQRLWRQLRVRRVSGAWNEPIGILTHHRNLDPAAWAFLEEFLARFSGQPYASYWKAAGSLIAQRHAPTSAGQP